AWLATKPAISLASTPGDTGGFICAQAFSVLSSTTWVNSGVGSFSANSGSSQADARGLGQPVSFSSRFISLLVAHWMKYHAASRFSENGLIAYPHPPMNGAASQSALGTGA